MFNPKKTLSQLEKNDWGQAPSDASPLYQTLYKLRHKPVENFTVEDLRITIGQGIGLQYLLPMALTILEQDPLAEGMHYKGDLLCNVLRVSPAFYNGHPELKEKAESVLVRAQETKKVLDEIDLECFEEALNEVIDVFKRG